MRTWKKSHRLQFVAVAIAAIALAVTMAATAGDSPVEEKPDAPAAKTDSAASHDDGAGDSEGAHRLAPLDRLVGEWQIEAEWGWGEKLKGRNTYEWADGGKVIKTVTYVNNKEGVEYRRYESFMAWDPDAGKPALIGFSYDGSIYEAHAVFEGENRERIRYEYTERYGNKRTNIDQYVEFVDDDTLRWVVKVKQGEEWQQVMDANWKRSK